jgi:thiamine-monophosphate kinase
LRRRAGEFERIRAIVSALPRGTGVVLGAGDDAAVLRPRQGCDLVVTTDAFVEGRHWRRELLSPRAVGRRLAAANLSDLAAMAATPRWALLACATSAAADPAEARATESACAAALAADGASVVGGNLTATDGPAWWTVTLIGEVERGRHWARSGARPGDVLAVTGSPGRAAAVLATAFAGAQPSFANVPKALVAWYGAPPSRVAAARAMAATGAVRAAIDISDGLAGDLAHLCEASGVGATIEEELLPADPLLAAVAAALAGGAARARARAERLRFGPGDDYELLLAVNPKRYDACAAAARAAGATLTSIGRVTASPGRLRLLRPAGAERALPGRGHDHFR